MDVREKLVDIVCDPAQINGCIHRCNHPPCAMVGDIVDALIENGVTVQEWIPVKDRLPENNQWALCFMKDKSFGTFCVFQWNYVDWQWNDGNEWFDEKDVTHWMPLPLPPKGE